MHAYFELVHFPYGLPELRQNYQKYSLRALAISITVNFAGLGAYWGAVYVQAFASQTEMNQYVGPEFGEGKNGDQTTIIAEESDLQIEEEGPPPDFVPFERPPAVISRIDPVYPDLARKANMEGKVIVKVWIDKQGKVKEVVTLKSTTEMFNESAIAAAKQWKFIPAMMKLGPVAVWSTLTFHFKLADPHQQE